MTAPLEVEIQTYNSKLPELLSHVGKYVLISGGDIVDYYDAYADALKAGYSQFGENPFMVKRIAPAEQVSFFTRSHIFECRA